MKNATVEWQFYSHDNVALESRRNLPHIDMPGVLTFVTFRLADSMPKDVVQRWHDEIELWLGDHGLAGHSVDQVLSSSATEESLKSELRRFKNRRWHGHLDDCHGGCILSEGRVRRVVADSLLHFDGERYDIERFVIMPNHVHVLLQMRCEFLLRRELRNLLQYSAREVNQLTGRTGSLWQTEPFDHLVRSEAQFEYLQKYIDENPLKARLREGEYTLYHCS